VNTTFSLANQSLLRLRTKNHHGIVAASQVHIGTNLVRILSPFCFKKTCREVAHPAVNPVSHQARGLDPKYTGQHIAWQIQERPNGAG